MKHDTTPIFTPILLCFFSGSLLFMMLALIFFSPPTLHAQRRGQDRPLIEGHTLYGDLKVEVKKGTNLPAMTFVIILYSSIGNVVDRQTLPSNGRYRFLNVPNGEYEIVVEKDNQEAARVRFVLNERQFTDIRRDLVLQWSPAAEEPSGRSATVSASDFYARAAENGPRFEKAMREISKKNYKQAAAVLRQVVDADPKDFEAWAELGTVEFMQGNHGQAEKAYRESLQEKPSYALALTNLGKVLMAQKNFEGAIEPLSRALEANPQAAEARYLTGEAYLQIKKGSKAVVHFNEALRLDPVGMAEAHLRLAALYNAAQMKDRAAAEYEQFLAKQPDYPDRKRLEQYIRTNKK